MAKPKCPKCGSTDIQIKATHEGALALCNGCGARLRVRKPAGKAWGGPKGPLSRSGPKHPERAAQTVQTPAARHHKPLKGATETAFTPSSKEPKPQHLKRTAQNVPETQPAKPATPPQPQLIQGAAQTVAINPAATVYAGGRIDRQAIRNAELETRVDWEVGDVILDLYEVRDLLGEGGMGKVYKVFHRGWNAELAVKAPKAEMLNKAGGPEAFKQEAQTWINLGLHPHVVSCYYVRDLGGIPRVFAEYVEGGSLHDWIYDRGLYEGGREKALERILDISIQFAWGLHYAHEQGLVHQDVKPANLMITSERTAKVTDFGLVGAVGAAGTPQYRSPEQEDAASPITDGEFTPAHLTGIDRTSDIWSWGLSVLEMFTGGLTWMFGRGARDVLDSYLEEGSESDVIPPMPEEVGELLHQCFVESPGERPQSMTTIASLLRGVYEKTFEKPYFRSEPERAHDTPETLNNKGISLLDLGRLDEARATWEGALGAHPMHLDATYNLNLVQWRFAEIDDDAMLNALEAAIGPKGGDGRGDYLLGLFHMERGDYNSAIRALSRAAEATDELIDLPDLLELAKKRATSPRQFIGHSEGSKLMAVSRDGASVVTACTSETSIRVWDMATGFTVRSLKGHDMGIKSIALSPDGKHVLSCDYKSMRLWDATTGECLRLTELGEGQFGSPTSVVFLADGRLAMTTHGYSLIVWDVKTGECVHRFETSPISASAVAVSKDERLAFTGAYQEPAALWDVKAGRFVRKMDDVGCFGTVVALSQDGNIGVTRATSDIHVFQTRTGRCIRTIKGHGYAVSDLSLSLDGRFLLSAASGAGGEAKLWDLETGRCLRTFRDFKSGAMQAELLDDGRFALALSWSGDMALWATPLHENAFTAPMVLSKVRASEAVQQAQTLYEQHVEAAKRAFNEGKFLQAAGELKQARSLPGWDRGDEAVALWRSLYRRLPRKEFRGAWEVITLEMGIRQDGSRPVAISPDSRFMVSATSGNDLKMWELPSGSLFRNLQGYGDVFVDFSVDGSIIVTAGFRGINLLDVSSGKPLRALVGSENRALHAAISNDLRFVAGWGPSEGVGVWEIQTGGMLKPLPAEWNERGLIGFSADSCFLVLSAKAPGHGSTDTVVEFWELVSGERVRTIQMPQVAKACLSHQGQLLLTGHWEKGGVKLWNTGTGKCVHSFDTEGWGVTFLGMTRDARHALVSCQDGVRLLDLRAGICVKKYAEMGASAFSPDAAWCLSVDQQGKGRVQMFDWELDIREPEGWNDEARPYLAVFLERWNAKLYTAPVFAELVAAAEETKNRGLYGESAWLARTAREFPGDHPIGKANSIWMELCKHLPRKSILGSLGGAEVPADRLATCADGFHLLTGRHEGVLELRKFFNNELIRRITPPEVPKSLKKGPVQQLSALAMSLDVRHAISVRDTLFQFWDLETGNEVRQWRGHNKKVTHVYFSRKGDFVLSVGMDDSLRVWEARTGRLRRGFGKRDGLWLPASFVLDDDQILVGDNANSLGLWDVFTGKCSRLLEGHTDKVVALAITADGQRALSGSFDGTLRLWDVRTGTCVQVLESDQGSIHNVAMSPDGRWAISRGSDQTVKLWEVPEQRCWGTVMENIPWATGMGIELHGRIVVCPQHNQRKLKLTVINWELEERQPAEWDEETRALVSGLMPAGKALVAGPQDEPRDWTDKELAPLMEELAQGGFGYITLETARAKLKEMHRQAASRKDGSTDVPAEDLGPAKLDQAHTLASPPDVVVDYSELLAGAREALEREQLDQAAALVRQARSQSGKDRDPDAIALWQELYRHLPRTGCNGMWEAHSCEGHTGLVSRLAMTPDGRYTLSGGLDGKVRVWSTESGECVRVVDPPPSPGPGSGLPAIAVSPTGDCALSSWMGHVVLWSIETGDKLAQWHGPNGMNALSFSPDGRMVLGTNNTRSGDTAIIVWDVASGTNVARFAGNVGFLPPAVFSVGGTEVLATTNWMRLKLWRLPTGEATLIREGHTDHVQDIALTADGSLAVSVAMDGTLRIWDLRPGQHHGEALRVIQAYGACVWSVGLSPDGRWALTVGQDVGKSHQDQLRARKIIKLWDLKNGSCIQTLAEGSMIRPPICLSRDGRFAVYAVDKTVKVCVLDWELEDRSPVDWDDGVRPIVDAFLAQHVPYGSSLVKERLPTQEQIHEYFSRIGKPVYTETDLNMLLHTLRCAGYGWVRPDEVKKRLEVLVKTWRPH